MQPHVWTRKRKFDRALFFSLLLSLLIHAGAAGILLLMRPLGVELALQLQHGEEALDLEIGSAFDSAPSRSTPEIAEARFADARKPLPPEEKIPEGEESALSAASDLKGALAILEPETRERIETEPIPEQPLTNNPDSRYHRRQAREEAPDTTEPEALEGAPEPPAPVSGERAQETAMPSEVRPDSVAAVAGAEAKPRGVIQRVRPMGSLVPVYPEYSRRMGEEGEALIHASVDASGRCIEAVVERSSGHAALDAVALDTVRRSRFAPASVDGMPFAMEDRFLIEFRLR
jgi:protein TonB